MKETRFNIGMNTLKQIDGLHGEEVYNTIQEISPAVADLLVELFGDIYTRPNLDYTRIPVNAGRLRGTAESTYQRGTQCRYRTRANRRDLHTLHPLCGISTRTECTVYGKSGL